MSKSRNRKRRADRRAAKQVVGWVDEVQLIPDRLLNAVGQRPRDSVGYLDQHWTGRAG